MNMIEKVARAIYDRKWITKWDDADSDFYVGIKDDCMKQVKADIEAMREPTIKMVVSGADIFNKTYLVDGKLDTGLIWRGMIDEALKT